jgi:hypothetical protein
MDWATGRTSPAQPFLTSSSSKAEWQNFSPNCGNWGLIPFVLDTLPSWDSVESSLRGSEYGLWAEGFGSRELTNADNLANIPSQLSVEIWYLLVESGAGNVASMGPDDGGSGASWSIMPGSDYAITVNLRLESGGMLFLNGEPEDYFKPNLPNVSVRGDGSFQGFRYRWVHLVFTYDANKDFKLYINGVLNVSRAAAGPLKQPPGNPRVGAGVGKFVISELVVYDRILDSGEIAQNYNMGKPSSYQDEAP